MTGVVIHATTRLRQASIVLGALLSLVRASGAQITPQVRVIVVDESGARIGDCDVVFKSDSKTLVSHTDTAGTVTVTLPSGRYLLTASHNGFLKKEVADFEVAGPALSELKVVLGLDNTCKNNSCILGPGAGGMEVPTRTSDVSAIVESEPAPEAPPPPMAKQTVAEKTRSWRCLYLWKCSKR
jgi:Carboxypeptidase regulatory-like domain